MRPRFPSHCLPAGWSLAELMVALAIGSVLVVGAVYLYAGSQSAYRLNERIARLQDQGRFVLSTIAPDIELAGGYGFTRTSSTLRLVQGGDPGRVIATANQMRQRSPRAGDPLPPPVPGLPPGAHVCGVNFAVDVLMPVQGSNNEFLLGRDAASGCDAYGGRPLPPADTLTIRRAGTQPAEPQANRLQLYARRLKSHTSHLLFADGVAPGPRDEHNEVHDLIVRTYYVARDSVDRPGHPALRVKFLTADDAGVRFMEDEVMPGVEDLQVQFGIDTGDYDASGTIDAGFDADGDGVPETDGRVTRYVDPDFPDLERYQVVAVRIWVRVRAEEPEAGYTDDETYRYADVVYRPTGEERRFRRVVVSRTIALRNARTL